MEKALYSGDLIMRRRLTERYSSVASMLDRVASSLEERGYLREAEEIDILSNTVEAYAFGQSKPSFGTSLVETAIKAARDLEKHQDQLPPEAAIQAFGFKTVARKMYESPGDSWDNPDPKLLQQLAGPLYKLEEIRRSLGKKGEDVSTGPWATLSESNLVQQVSGMLSKLMRTPS